MNPGAELFFRTAFALLFLGVLLAGIYLWRHSERLFGADQSIPSEGESSRAYTKAQVFLIWIHALFLTGTLALLLH